MSDDDNIEFTFSWLALQLLGKGLYSNPWSALSELVANGLDARASQVYVYVDARDKARAVIEVFDNGSGMTRADLHTYATVGHDKRKPGQPEAAPTTDRPMGRKGIGKLAALYLSPRFFIRTRRDGQDSTWSLDVRSNLVKDDDYPALQSEPQFQDSPNISRWSAFESGTFLSLRDVDLRGHGEQALRALSARLANQFFLPSLARSAAIYIAVAATDAETTRPSYVQAEKNIAYGNLSAMRYRVLRDAQGFEPSKQLAAKVAYPAPALRSGVYEQPPKSKEFSVTPDKTIDGWAEVEPLLDLEARTYNGRPVALWGWIGIHSSIDTETARKNDARFVKNKFYNPAQLRLYVRGKLASDRLLEQLGITGTFLNYVEGEISFDLLDDDTLPDIATSNRQDFDETDARIILLRALVRPLVRGLMSERQEIAADIRRASQKQKDLENTASKRIFAQQLGADLASYDLPESIRSEIHSITTNKIKGDIAPKTDFRVFVSHAQKDKRFADLIYGLLTSRGVHDSEIFYTSKDGDVTPYLERQQRLTSVIKDAITSANTLIFYLTSHHFLRSQFCLFEGGAGWATRSVASLLKLNVSYEAIPKFLTEGNSELSMMAGRDISLTQELHEYLVEGVLNPMIEHLNQGRVIAGSAEIPKFVLLPVPSKVERARVHKELTDYFDKDILEHWAVYVEDGLQDYIETYPHPSS